MHPKVRQMYRSFMWIAKDYPEGAAKIKPKIKAAFLKNASVDSSDKESMDQLLERGAYVLKELEALVFLHKYRMMKRNYETNVPSFAEQTSAYTSSAHPS